MISARVEKREWRVVLSLRLVLRDFLETRHRSWTRLSTFPRFKFHAASSRNCTTATRAISLTLCRVWRQLLSQELLVSCRARYFQKNNWKIVWSAKGLITLRWQLIADLNERPNRTEWFVAFFLNSSVWCHFDNNSWEVINLSFVLPILFYLNILETERTLQFWDKKSSTCVRKRLIKNEDSILCHFYFELQFDPIWQRNEKLSKVANIAVLFARYLETAPWPEASNRIFTNFHRWKNSNVQTDSVNSCCCSEFLFIFSIACFALDKSFGFRGMQF